MEMVLDMAVSDRIHISWERLLRVCLIFLLSGVLFLSVQSYTGSTEEGRERNAGKAMCVGSGKWILKADGTETDGNPMSMVRALPGENTRDMKIISVVSEEKPEITGMTYPAEEGLDPLYTEMAPEGRRTMPQSTEVPVTGGMKITADIPGESSTESNMPVIDGSETTIEDPKETAGRTKSKDMSGEETDAAVNGLGTSAGFKLDAEGYITGIDGNVDVTDDVLIIPLDPGCIGIRESALSGLGDCVFEMYIPANIRDIEPGAFAGLTSLMYIETAADNPCYYSVDGILYSGAGEKIFNPSERLD